MFFLPWKPICRRSVIKSQHEVVFRIGRVKDSLKAELEPYKCKNEVEIPALGFVDNLLTVYEKDTFHSEILAL